VGGKVFSALEDNSRAVVVAAAKFLNETARYPLTLHGRIDTQVNQSYLLPRQGEVRVADDPFTLECHEKPAIVCGLLEDRSRKEPQCLTSPISKRNDLIEHWAIGARDNPELNHGPSSPSLRLVMGATLLRPHEV
jgi:hypothetical protein